MAAPVPVSDRAIGDVQFWIAREYSRSWPPWPPHGHLVSIIDVNSEERVSYSPSPQDHSLYVEIDRDPVVVCRDHGELRNCGHLCPARRRQTHRDISLLVVPLVRQQPQR